MDVFGWTSISLDSPHPISLPQRPLPHTFPKFSSRPYPHGHFKIHQGKGCRYDLLLWLLECMLMLFSSQDSFKGNQGQKCEKGRSRRSSLDDQAEGPHHRLLPPTEDPSFAPDPQVPPEVRPPYSSYGPIPGDRLVCTPKDSSSA